MSRFIIKFLGEVPGSIKGGYLQIFLFLLFSRGCRETGIDRLRKGNAQRSYKESSSGQRKRRLIGRSVAYVPQWSRQASGSEKLIVNLNVVR